MLQRLKDNGTKIHTYVDGLCASAGTFILMMGDDINLYENSMIMIHKPVGYCEGNALDFQKYIDLLDTVENSTMIPLYMKKSKVDESKLKELINDESWLGAKETEEIFHIGKTNEDFLKDAIMPIATAFCTALNRDFLLEKEKKSYYFAPDYTELIRCTIKERFEAYQIAIASGFKTRNEVRYLEGDDALEGLDMINLGLGDVLLDTKTNQIYTPNTNKMDKMGEKKEENMQNNQQIDKKNNNLQPNEEEEKGGEQNEEVL